MAPLPAIRSAVLEEVVLYLLRRAGYRTISPPTDGTKVGGAGLELQGRGEWHQIDGMAACDFTPAFVYPLRLLVEAKCYSSAKVDLPTIRNSLGVLFDVSQNYFTHKPSIADVTALSSPRFNFVGAIFSTSGYTTAAQRYAIAHQIFLIQYSAVGAIADVVRGIMRIRKSHLVRPLRHQIGSFFANIRKVVRASIEATADDDHIGVFTRSGLNHLRESVASPLLAMKGSYVGMLQGKWPLHLLAKDEFPAELVRNRDTVRCKVRQLGYGRWCFEPVDQIASMPYRLDFDLPEEVARLVQRVENDAVQLAMTKEEYFSSLTLSGRIGSIQRQIELKLDRDWLARFLATRSGDT